MNKLYDRKEEAEYQPPAATELIEQATAVEDPTEIYFEPKAEAAIEYDEGLLNSIRAVAMSDDKPEKIVAKFTTRASKYTLELDSTNFLPRPIVLLAGKNFDKKYMHQLEGILFDKKGEVDQKTLMTILYLVDCVENGRLPIQIKSSKCRTYLQNLTTCMNKYFNENYKTLLNIYTMFNGVAYKYKQDET